MADNRRLKVLIDTSGELAENVSRFLAVELDSGKLQLPDSAGNKVLGIVNSTVEALKTGDTVQVVQMGLVTAIAGTASGINVGTPVRFNTAGKAVAAAATQAYEAVAITAPSANNDQFLVYINALETRPVVPAE